jgi:hypothetical protein
MEHASSIFRMKKEGKQESTIKQLANIMLCVWCWFVAWFIFLTLKTETCSSKTSVHFH